MILPEKLKESERSYKFRENTPLYGGMKVIALQTKNERHIFKEIIDVRFYASRAGVIYCAVWIHDGEYQGRGVGVASGGGYHMTSAALSSAINDMGIKGCTCSCVGDDAMNDALLEIGRLLGNNDVQIVKFYR